MSFGTRLSIPGTTNTRDLGGAPAANGQRIKPRTFYRGEALAMPGTTAKVAIWNDAHVAAYRDLGIATVIDLRRFGETESAPSVWAQASKARLQVIPVNEGGEGDDTDFTRQLRAGTLRSFSAEDLATYYALTVRRRADVFGRVIQEIANPGAVPVFVHCTAGKDRTGILVALVLEALGVPRELVVSDYGLTEVFRPDRVLAYADILDSQGIDHAAVKALFGSPPATMKRMLDGLDAEFGSVEKFLEQRAGITPPVLDDLRAALLEPA